MSKRTPVSIIVPAFNEEKNIPVLYLEIKKVMSCLKKDFEIIFVDDGSSDTTRKILSNLNRKDPIIKAISLAKNSGKVIAQETGIKFSKGEVIVTMDSDLQHGPGDIPKFLEKISQGYDLVVGWRQKRRDPWPRIFFSKVVNIFVFLMSGFKAHDFYCGFKCYRREVIDALNLHGDLFRFIALLASRKGFKTTEVPIAYHYRCFGRSKYGFGLFKRGFYDLLIIAYIIKGFRYSFLEKLVNKRIVYKEVRILSNNI